MKISNSLDRRPASALFSTIVLILIQTACMPFLNLKKDADSPKSLIPSSNHNAKKVLAEQLDLKSPLDVAKNETYQLLLANDFDAIEKLASDARKKKERLVGGYWKLDSIYEGLTNIYSEYPGQEVTDEIWKNRIELLTQWKDKSPESITARVALAKAFIGYGWFARGYGYSDTVSENSRHSLQDRLDRAEKELLDARKLGVECPGWYREMLYIGMAKGWTLEEFDEMYNEAIRKEPNYLQFYLVNSENLTPKWNGQPGDWRKFVDSIPSKLATLQSDEADMIYFIVLVNKLRDPSLGTNWAMVSKDRVQKGFAQLDKKYGADNLRLNQHAFVSCLTLDFASANKSFDKIGNEWNKEVWGQQTFTQMKQLANQGGTITPK